MAKSKEMIQAHEENKVFWENGPLMKNILELIRSINLKEQKAKDGDIDIKTFITLLDQIGDLIKKEDPFYKNKNNLEVVREFVDWFISQRLYEDPEYQELMIMKEKLLKKKRKYV